MADENPRYMTTREVARYLRLNEKKVYALVAEGKLPAARVSGKWLFPRALIDRWVAEHTVYPSGGLMTGLLEDLLILQGSDDWLLGQVVERYQQIRHSAVPMASVGSVAGLEALAAGQAHLAGLHVNPLEQGLPRMEQGSYLVHLFARQQGLLFATGRDDKLDDLKKLSGQKLRIAQRQEASGTHRLWTRLLAEAEVDSKDFVMVGPFASHLELALAIRSGQADLGLGIRVAAERAGLDFAPLHTESFDLAVPANFVSHPRVARFLEFVLEEIRSSSETPGYDKTNCGKLVVLGSEQSTP